MDTNKPQSRLEQLKTLSQQSLIKVQYSCGGNSTGVDETDDYIPIVPEDMEIRFHTRIRPAGIDDTEQITELLQQRQLVLPQTETGKRRFLVAEYENKIVGCAVIELHDASCLLRMVVVANHLQKKGTGSMLLHEACREAQTAGAKEIDVIATAETQKFFQRAGWTTISPDPENTTTSQQQSSNTGEHCIRMRLSI